MNLYDHAKMELKIAGLLDESGDFYGGMTGKSVLELIECFSNQGHSGMSAPYVINLFSKLAKHEPINPIYGTDDEWSDVSKISDCEKDEYWYQNVRLSSVFKEGKDARPYYLDAIVWREPSGSCFTGTVENISSRQFIKLPFIPKTFYVDIDENRKIINKKELKKALNYYYNVTRKMKLDRIIKKPE